MLRLILTIAFLWSLITQAAAWEARNVALIPPRDDGSTGQIRDWATVTGDAGGWIVQGFDFRAAYANAPIALNTLQKATNKDIAALVKAGFPDPATNATFYDTFTGLAYLPLYLLARDYKGGGKFNAPARALCNPGRGWIELNAKSGKAFNLDKMANPMAGKFDAMINFQTVTIMHEIMHLVQQRGHTANCDARGWLNEGMANAVSHYIASKHRPRAFRANALYWDRRDYSVDLALSTLPDGPEDNPNARKARMSYATGSFFRYLMEAAEGSTQDGLKLARMITTEISARDASVDRWTIDRLSELLMTHYGRDLSLILPEFLTEYGSYGGRYRANSWRSHARWINRAFDGCVEITLDAARPIQEVDLEVMVNAGECLDVRWNGFSQPVGLQFYAEGSDLDGLHLGQAVRARPATGSPQGCYDATKKLPQRIKRPMRQKCMLKRGRMVLDGADVATWTSDQPLSGGAAKAFHSGRGLYVFSVVDKGFHSPVTLRSFKLTVGANLVTLTTEDNEQNQAQPPEPASAESQPIQQGRAKVKQRVAAHHMAPDRHLIDGQSTHQGGEAFGYMEGMRALSDAEGDQPTVMVPLGDYTLFLVDLPGATPNGGEASAVGTSGNSDEVFRGVFVIAKDTAQSNALMQSMSRPGMPGLDAFAAMGALGSPIANGVEFNAVRTPIVTDEGELVQKTVSRCDVVNTAAITSGDLSPGLVVAGAMDLFDFTQIGAAMADICAVLEAGFDRRVSFRIHLPYRKQYMARTILRHRSPAQEIYDTQEFLDGPNFGGVATAEYYALAALKGELDSADGPGGPGGGGSGAGAALGCACSTCPGEESLPTAQCLQICAPQWAGCGAKPEPEAPALDFQDLLKRAAKAPAQTPPSPPAVKTKAEIEALIERQVQSQPAAIRDVVRQQLRKKYMKE
jgi:hypothetical protein